MYGIVWPHIDTVQDAYSAVAAMRYPKSEAHPLREPFGRRGDAPGAPSSTGASPRTSTTTAPTSGRWTPGRAPLRADDREPQSHQEPPNIITKRCPASASFSPAKATYRRSSACRASTNTPRCWPASTRSATSQSPQHAQRLIAHTTLDNVEQVIKDGYRVLMAPSSRSYAVLNKGRTVAGRG